jgi:hypothetical protein
MAFATGDRLRLLKCLNLSKDQLKDGSRLAVLMTDLEDFDTTHDTALVTEVREQLDLWEDAGEALPAIQTQDIYSSISIPNEISSTTTPGSSTAVSQGQRRGYVDTILKYLDEYGQLQPFIMTGRVIQSL